MKVAIYETDLDDCIGILYYYHHANDKFNVVDIPDAQLAWIDDCFAKYVQAQKYLNTVLAESKRKPLGDTSSYT